jgi:GntR family transcriptional regulator
MPAAHATTRPAASTTPTGPLYRRVQAALTRKLAAGVWKPGEAIPSEHVLAKVFKVSVGTLRKAVDELAAGNILVRRQGRGTFVTTHGDDRTLFHFFHITRKDGTRELPVHELLSFRAGTAAAAESAALDIGLGTPVLRMENLLTLAGQPAIHDSITVPSGLFKGLTERMYRERESTIYGLYQARFGINVIRISERLAAERPPAEVARNLRMEESTPTLVIRRVACTYNDTPVEFRVSWLDTREHEYLADLWKGDIAR